MAKKCAKRTTAQYRISALRGYIGFQNRQLDYLRECLAEFREELKVHMKAHKNCHLSTENTYMVGILRMRLSALRHHYEELEKQVKDAGLEPHQIDRDLLVSSYFGHQSDLH